LEDNSRIGRTGIIAYAPLFLWIGVIFYLSSDQGSMTETSRFIRPLLEFLFPNAPEAALQAYHGYIRKAAHFTEYSILAALAACAFTLSASGDIREYRYVLSLLLVAFIASADEIGQSFRPSRTGSVWDVMIDVLGGLTMIVVIWLAGRLRIPGRTTDKIISDQ
jgi:VanZ family protein